MMGGLVRQVNSESRDHLYPWPPPARWGGLCWWTLDSQSGSCCSILADNNQLRVPRFLISTGRPGYGKRETRSRQLAISHLLVITCSAAGWNAGISLARRFFPSLVPRKCPPG
jgi:hypothetical protein